MDTDPRGKRPVTTERSGLAVSQGSRVTTRCRDSQGKTLPRAPDSTGLDTLTQDFRPPERREYIFYYFKQLGLWCFVTLVPRS